MSGFGRFYIGNLIYYVFLGFFSLVFLGMMTGIIVIVATGTLESTGFPILIPFILFMTISLAVIITMVVLITKSRRNFKLNLYDLDELEMIESEEVFFEPSVEISIEPFEKEKKFEDLQNITSDASITWEKIYPLIYQEKEVEEQCPICKLEIEEKEFIMQCPNCLKLFHGKHLVEWLLENSSCPICKTIIDIQ